MNLQECVISSPLRSIKFSFKSLNLIRCQCAAKGKLSTNDLKKKSYQTLLTENAKY